MNSGTIILSVIILIFLQSCFGLECYTCSSQIGVTSDLNDCEYFSGSSSGYYENHKKSTCMSGGEVCAKYTVNHDGMIWVHRGCKPYDVCTYLNEMYDKGRDNMIECSICSDRNLCNSSSLDSGSLLVVIITSLVWMLKAVF